MVTFSSKHNRAKATARTSSSKVDSRSSFMRVSSFARKFWTIISPIQSPPSSSSANFRISSNDFTRSSAVSPIPTRIPVVNGTLAFPAFLKVFNLTLGRFDSHSKCAMPGSIKRSDVVSTINP